MSKRGSGKTAKKTPAKKQGAGPVAFFVSLFIVALGSIQLVSTFHTYALNLSELNGLKRQEAVLIERKQDAENEIARWNDKAYVTAQARERLGFVFPGEQAIRVEHPEAVTGQTESPTDSDTASPTQQKVLPWYSELAYAFKKADEPNTPTTQSNSPGTKKDPTGTADGKTDSKSDTEPGANSDTSKQTNQ